MNIGNRQEIKVTPSNHQHSRILFSPVSFDWIDCNSASFFAAEFIEIHSVSFWIVLVMHGLHVNNARFGKY
jgi:hypothetical protein